MVSEARIKELQLIIKEEYGEDISYEETSILANILVRYFSNLEKAYLSCKKKEIW